MATEYGLTRGTPDEMARRFGGGRAAAVREGFATPWTRYDGQAEPRLPSATELVERGQLAGIAPWGSPAPGVWAGFDAEPLRGVAGSPDEGSLWAVWGDLGAALESANRAAGHSAACLTLRSAAAP